MAVKETKSETLELPDFDWDPDYDLDEEDCTEEENNNPDLKELRRPKIAFNTAACLSEMWLCGACDYKDEVALILSSPATARQKIYAIVCVLMPSEADPDECNSDDEIELRHLYNWLYDYYDLYQEETLGVDRVKDIEDELYTKLIQPLTDRMEQQGWMLRKDITMSDCIENHNSWFVGDNCDNWVDTPTDHTAFIHTLRWLYGKNDDEE